MTHTAEDLVVLRNALVIELKELGITDNRIEIVNNVPFGPKEPEIQVLLKYTVEDDGDAENGQHLRIDSISWVSLRVDDEGWFLILTTSERFENEEEVEAYYNSASSWEEFIDEDPDMVIRLSKTNMLSDHYEVAKEVRLLISAFKL